MKIRGVVSQAAKRIPILGSLIWGAYGIYWRGRTARDVVRQYGESPMSILDDKDSPEPTLDKLTSQLCTASQCLEQRYLYWCREMKSPARLGRKQWEFVFILETLFQHGMLAPGRRGLGFGCGREPMPAIMAKNGCQVVATDLAMEAAAGKGWVETDQHASSLEMLNGNRICDHGLFRDRVTFHFADMNKISADLQDFDFVWSSCAFEHLGSIRHGLDFVKSAMRCLKPGGIAVHTTEFNLSSNEETFEDPNCVLFRKQDILLLEKELALEGYKMASLNFNPGHHPVDKHIDFPPFSSSPHLKLKIGEFATTSVGLIITKPMSFVPQESAL